MPPQEIEKERDRAQVLFKSFRYRLFVRGTHTFCIILIIEFELVFFTLLTKSNVQRE